MAKATVTVIRPRNRDIYIGGNYAQRRGRSAPDTLSLESGGYIATTLNDERKIDFRGEFTVNARGEPLEVELDPVEPPEAI